MEAAAGLAQGVVVAGDVAPAGGIAQWHTAPVGRREARQPRFGPGAAPGERRHGRGRRGGRLPREAPELGRVQGPEGLGQAVRDLRQQPRHVPRGPAGARAQPLRAEQREQQVAHGALEGVELGALHRAAVRPRERAHTRGKGQEEEPAVVEVVALAGLGHLHELHVVLAVALGVQPRQVALRLPGVLLQRGLCPLVDLVPKEVQVGHGACQIGVSLLDPPELRPVLLRDDGLQVVVHALPQSPVERRHVLPELERNLLLVDVQRHRPACRARAHFVAAGPEVHEAYGLKRLLVDDSPHQARAHRAIPVGRAQLHPSKAEYVFVAPDHLGKEVPCGKEVSQAQGLPMALLVYEQVPGLVLVDALRVRPVEGHVQKMPRNVAAPGGLAPDAALRAPQVRPEQRALPAERLRLEEPLWLDQQRDVCVQPQDFAEA
mmetsp:Transcript_64894/g.156854  ORF Transcript_64894/g.156854 Transcript_64894/m.156854 type:complete len:433 (+) Transcript_64894:169-1467(+)